MQIARDLSFRVKLKCDVLHPARNADQKPSCPYAGPILAALRFALQRPGDTPV